MNPNQLAQQIKADLASAVWPGGDLVFGARNVLVHSGAAPNEEQHPIDFPFALVAPGDATFDEEDPDLITSQQMSVVICARVHGDTIGEYALIGGARAATLNSEGAGVLEIAPRVLNVVGDKTTKAGARIQVSGQSTVGPVRIGRNTNVAYHEIQLTAVCTVQPFYPEPQQLQVSGSTWTWRGDEAANRFDFLGFVLGYVAGSTPAASVASVTPVYAETAQTTTHTPVAGRAYSVFATYGPRGVIEGSSDGSLVGTFVVT